MTKHIAEITDEQFEKGIAAKVAIIEENEQLMFDPGKLETVLLNINKVYTEVGIDYGMLQAKFEYYKKMIDIVIDRQPANLSPAQRKLTAYNELIAMNVEEGQINAYERYQTSKMRFNRYKSMLEVLNTQITIVSQLIHLN
ncbi:hypothetical protein [Lactococcus fujiensis]|nr:hypothetical protein [Lactococcus fujiensis]